MKEGTTTFQTRFQYIALQPDSEEKLKEIEEYYGYVMKEFKKGKVDIRLWDIDDKRDTNAILMHFIKRKNHFYVEVIRWEEYNPFLTLKFKTKEEWTKLFVGENEIRRAMVAEKL